MTQVRKIIASGVAPQSAQVIAGDFATGLTATGNSQATGLVLPADANEFTTVASSTGCVIPAQLNIGDAVMVFNFGANALSVYPPVGESINALSANTAFSVASGGRAAFWKANNTRWAAILSA